MANESCTEDKVGLYNATCVAGAFIFLMGFCFLTYFVLWPLIKKHQVRSWPEIECEILSSDIKVTESTTGGAIYKLNINFSYSYQGNHFQSNRYDYNTKGCYSLEMARSIGSTFKPGTTTMCRVNPREPSEACLSTELYKPVVRTLQCLAPFCLGLFMFLGARKAKCDYLRLGQDLAIDSRKPKVYRCRRRRLLRCGFCVAVAFLIFLFSQGQPLYMRLALACLTFGFMVMAFKDLILAVLLPVDITLVPGTLRTGEDLEVRWKIGLLAGRVARLTVGLTSGQTLGNGTESEPDHPSYFCKTVTITEPARIKSGATTFVVPVARDVQETARTGVRWIVVLRGEVQGLPSIKEECEFTVEPG